MSLAKQITEKLTGGRKPTCVFCAPILFFLFSEKEKNRRSVRRSLLHSASAGAAKAPYSQPPSSFPKADRCAGSPFGSNKKRKETTREPFGRFSGLSRSTRQKKRAALHFRLTPKAPYSLAPSSFPNCDRSAGSQFGSGERPWNLRRMEIEKSTIKFVGADDSVRPAVGKDGYRESAAKS